MSLSSTQLSLQIDQLFEQYLHLLHQYDSLRQRLGVLQASTLQNISRANFSAPRGTRYGQDLYDSRITALRLLSITNDTDNSSTPSFALSSSPSSHPVGRQGEEDASTESQAQNLEINEEVKETLNQENEEVDGKGEEKKETNSRIKDPLHMFGMLNIPSSLRLAQTSAISMVSLLPSLVNISTQMQDLEIQIRRARKFRLKAEASEKTSPHIAKKDSEITV